MRKYIENQSDIDALDAASVLVTKACRLLSEAYLKLAVDGGEVGAAAAVKLAELEEQLGYVPYNLLTPQAEWTGGETWKHRWPHGLQP